jgi:hypothetical protein
MDPKGRRIMIHLSSDNSDPWTGDDKRIRKGLGRIGPNANKMKTKNLMNREEFLIDC